MEPYFLNWSLYFKLGLVLLKSTEAGPGVRCITANDCGGYNGAVCINKTCSCASTIQEDQCKDVEVNSNEDTVLGVVFGTVFMICVGIIVFLLHRKFRRKVLIAKKTDDGEKAEINTSPIQIESLGSHVQEFLRHDGLEVRKEFLNLKALVTGGEATDAKLPENKDKNRSSRIPYNSNRVKLSESSGYLGENYINASYVFEDKYIITQFPLRTTLNDFWRMIWEQNVSNIIMVAPLNELKKCHRYYSRYIGKVCITGDLKVEVLATNMYGDNLKIRNFLFRRNEEERTITHFHIYALNHLSLATELIETIKCIRSNVHFEAHSSPIVVHSGSAVEWSGVFVDYLIQKLENGDDLLDIPTATLQLLNERRSPITEDQYVLVYSCIQEYVKKKTNQISLEHSDIAEYDVIP